MNRRERRRAEAQQRAHEARLRKDAEEREGAKGMGATSDKGFQQYRELFRRAYSKSSDREIGEGFMRDEAAAASGIDGMIIHPTGENPSPVRDDDIRLSARYGTQSFKARAAASYLPTLVNLWPDFLRQMRETGIEPPTTDDKRMRASSSLR